MPFWGSRSGNDDAVDDFDDYDPTPYSGGYDQVLTYGRPLPPSDDTCYSLSTAGGVDYERPNYCSGSQSSIYEVEADFGDRYGRPRPKPQPTPSGFQPKPHNEPNFGYGGDGSAGGDYGSSYGSRPQKPEYGSGFGLDYGGGRPKRDEEDEAYGRKPQYGSEYGTQKEKHSYGKEEYSGGGYRRNDEEGYGGGEYRKNEKGGYRRSEEEGYDKPGYGEGDYRKSDEEGYGKQSYGGVGYEQQSYGEGEYREGREQGYGRHRHGGGEYRKEGGYEGGGGGYKSNEDFDYGVKTSYGGQRYGGEEEERSKYKKSSYGEDESSGKYEKLTYGEEEESGIYRKSSYGEEEESGGHRKPSHYGGGRSKYGRDSHDDEENKLSYEKNHHRHSYDD